MLVKSTFFSFNCWRLAFLGLVWSLLLGPTDIFAQTKGLIFDPATGAGSALLDPNGDNYVSSDTNGFISDDESESEIEFIAIPTGGEEEDGDVAHGADCSYIDFVQTENTSSLYFYSDGTYLFFRFRIGGASNSSKTYSVFIDTDEKYGFSGNSADPNAVTGNPGFEVELSLHTNGGIGIYDVDGNVDPSGNEIDGPYKTTRPADVHSQRSVALTEACDDEDYFYDFYVAFDDFAGLSTTLNSSTKMRMVAQSGISANPILGTTSGTDLGGVDDDTGNTFDLIEDLVDIFPPISGDDLASGSPVLPRAACPEIDSPVAIGDTEVSGTSTEANGATIEVFVDDVSVGTTNVISGVWTLSGLAAFAGGEVVTATASIDGVKSESRDDCDPETVSQICSEIPTITGRVNGGATGRGLYGTSSEEGAIVTIWTDAALTTEWTGDGGTYPNPGEVGVGGATGTSGEWQISGSSNALAAGVYYVTVENSPDECESDPAVYCNEVTASDVPVITTADILSSTTTIDGTSVGNADIELFIDGISSGLTDTATPGGDWSISVSDLEFGSIITVMATESGECPSESASKTVTRYSIAPLIQEEFCAGASGVTEIHGISSEPFGTTVKLYTNGSSPVVTGSPVTTGTVDANGNWSITGINLLAGTFAAVTNTATGELESTLSNEIEILSQTSDGSLDISTLIISEGDESISGTGTNGNTIALYIDDARVEGFSTTVSGGTWDITGLNEASAGYDVLYPGGQVGVVSIESGKCASDQVYAVDVIQCKDYAASSLALSSSATICVNETVSLSFSNSESLVFYQLYTDENGTNPTGQEIIGDGGDLELTSDPLATDITKMYLKARRIGVTCDEIFSSSFNIDVKGTPALTLANNSLTLCDDATSGALDYTNVTNGPLLSYDIDFNTDAESQGFTDITAASVATQLTFDIPADALNGTYEGTLSVSNSSNGSCVSTDYTFTFQIIEDAITHGLIDEPTSCLMPNGSIEISGLAPNTFYSLTYLLNNTEVTEASIESTVDGTYTLDNLDEGEYNMFQVTRSECPSNVIDEVIIFECSQSLNITPVLTPNGDGVNDLMEIDGIEDFPNNKVLIFNRWGNLIWEKEGYRNDETAFGGEGNSSLASGKLTDGTYFIVIDRGDGSQPEKRFVVIKR